MRIAISVLALLAAIGCNRPDATVGVDCTLNSDCGQPLVCRLERCRRQCVDSRDCGAGLRCLLIGDQGGVCQLPDERECALSSECSDPLVCRFETCTTECAEDRDCPPGASCELDMTEGGYACDEPIDELCVYDSDCPHVRQVCNDDQRCVFECDPDAPLYRDCAAPRVCVDFRCELPDGGG